MRIQKRQCLLGILSGKLFLSIGQVSICKIVMGVGRIGISQQVELEDLECRLLLEKKKMARCYDVDHNFCQPLRCEIFTPRVCRSTVAIPDDVRSAHSR